MMMKKQTEEIEVEQYVLPDDGTFPNSHLPVLIYRDVLRLPRVFAPVVIKRLFRRNGWSNSWNYGIFEYHHYHSIAHEVLGVHKGATSLLLGGSKGVKVNIRRGDVIIIPAGVAHRNLGREDQVQCVGAYPGGSDYDINYGKVGERPKADRNISKVPIPDMDPVFGKKAGLIKFW
jgi:uncharacterized protein YjlB